MNRPRLASIAWIMTLLGLLLVLTIPLQLRPERVLPVLAYLLLVLVLLCAGLTLLMLVYRGFFSRWQGWALALGLMVGFHLLVSLPLGSLSPRVSLFVSLGMVAFSWGVGVSTALALWRSDLGLPLLAWAAVAGVWLLVAGWRLQGSLFELWFTALQGQSTGSAWWLGALCCGLGWLLPLGALSFLGHTLKLALWELGDGSGRIER